MNIKEWMAHLRDKCTDKNADENHIGEDTGEDVSFAVDLPGVNFIKYLHEYEGVEDHGEMLRRCCMQRETSSVVNVENNIA